MEKGYRRRIRRKEMAKSLIVYFSLGGTTAQVAKAIADGLRAAGHEVDLCNIRNQQPPPLDGYEALGIGTPTYYFRPPFNVTDYVDSLPSLNGLPAFTFVLHGTYQGDAGNVVQRASCLTGCILAAGACATWAGSYVACLRIGGGLPVFVNLKGR